MTKIKICGMTCENDIHYANEYLPDYVGFVLYFPKSRRNISMETARHLLKMLRPEIKSVAVVVSPDKEQVKKITAAGFDQIQIHGMMTEEVYREIKIPILRAFNVSDLSSFSEYEKKEKITGYVFDSKKPGSGKTFDWNQVIPLRKKGTKKIFLAGGIDETNVKKAMREVKPDVIDLSSAVERPDVNGKCGGKDPEKMKIIIRMVHDEK
ncbi:MAG: phosphoribosylanthranilate isomerase [Lachnospiraceae bacterium]|nr:phosphoribosylanthranilate isomerase [Lachnospiraceae bacterium]MDY5497286.1 phosphoribosylanthranilate isomerase [Anaerobutyricum sp.]